MTTASKSSKPAYGGRHASYQAKKQFLINNGKDFIIEEKGSEITLHETKRQTRYLDLSPEEARRGNAITTACQMLNRRVKNYQWKHGIPEYGEYTLQDINPMFTTAYILSGKRDVTLVDISHCYWRIPFVHGIIDENLYEKYKDNRDARIVSVGCLAMDRYKYFYKGGQLVWKETIANPLRWAWNFIAWKAYTAVDKVRKHFRGQIFSYQTDGIYMQPQHADKAVQLLADEQLLSKVKEYTIVGWNRHYIVLQNKLTKRYRRSNLGMNNSIKKVIPSFDFRPIDLAAYCEDNYQFFEMLFNGIKKPATIDELVANYNRQTEQESRHAPIQAKLDRLHKLDYENKLLKKITSKTKSGKREQIFWLLTESFYVTAASEENKVEK